jgi:lysosomal Pro-X carboxypeptidase
MFTRHTTDLNNTGLMWESAPQYNALLVFAEHRYFGQSMPFGAESSNYMDYLSAEQV